MRYRAQTWHTRACLVFLALAAEVFLTPRAIWTRWARASIGLAALFVILAGLGYLSRGGR